MNAMMSGLSEMFAHKRSRGAIEPQLLEENRARVEAFLGREHFYEEANRGMGYLALFLVSFEDPATTADTVERAVVGMAEHERRNLHIVFAIAPRFLAETHGRYEVARATIAKGLAIYDPPRPADAPEGDHRALVTNMYAALAVVESEAGDLDAAEEALGAARRRGHGPPEQLEEAAGRLALARGDAEQAEQHFARGLGLSSNCVQCRDGLERIHRERGGAPDDFEAYLERATEEEVAKRKKRVLAELAPKGSPLPPFELADLDGRTWSTADLRGKIAIINFWTLSCGPCERELPRLAKLAADFEQDPDVVVLTVGPGSPVELQAHLHELDVQLPTLVTDRETVRAWNVTAFPTTWVVDEKGRIAVSVSGQSSAAREEFTWRIEGLRGR